MLAYLFCASDCFLLILSIDFIPIIPRMRCVGRQYDALHAVAQTLRSRVELVTVWQGGKNCHRCVTAISLAASKNALLPLQIL